MLIRLTLLLFLFYTISCTSMEEYKIIKGFDAIELKSKENAQYLMTINYNLAAVYQLPDASYLVMPLNPYAHCIQVKDKDLLDKWINESYFPTNEPENEFYFSNKNRIDSLLQYKDELKENLLKYIYKGKQLPEINAQEIDSIYKLLRQRKRFKEYKLNFIVLAGDYLIEKYPEENLCWGLYESKQLLNPVVFLILVKHINGEKQYFKLQDKIEGKWGYIGMVSIEHRIQQFWLRSDEIETISKVF